MRRQASSNLLFNSLYSNWNNRSCGSRFLPSPTKTRPNHGGAGASKETPSLNRPTFDGRPASGLCNYTE